MMGGRRRTYRWPHLALDLLHLPRRVDHNAGIPPGRYRRRPFGHGGAGGGVQLRPLLDDGGLAAGDAVNGDGVTFLNLDNGTQLALGNLEFPRDLNAGIALRCRQGRRFGRRRRYHGNEGDWICNRSALIRLRFLVAIVA